MRVERVVRRRVRVRSCEFEHEEACGYEEGGGWYVRMGKERLEHDVVLIFTAH